MIQTARAAAGGVLAVIPPPPTNGFHLGPLFVHFYGVAIALGVLAAFWLANRRWRQAGRDPAELEPVLLWSVLAGFIGGRIGYVLPRLTSGVFDPWWEVVAIWQGGLALYGGLTLGVGTGLLLAWRRGIPLALAADTVIPAIPLAQAIGRWGNYFNQELFGTPLSSSIPWALEIEPAHRPEQYAQFATFHPTFLYESLYNLLVVAALLWLGRQGRLRPGGLALCYGVMYGVGRFGLELIRTDTTFRLLGLSRNAWVSLLVITGCLAGLWWRQRHQPTAVADPAHDAETASANDAETTPVGSEARGGHPDQGNEEAAASGNRNAGASGHHERGHRPPST